MWVGTGEGTLITFDVFTQAHKTSSDCSDYLTDAAVIPISLPPREDAKADLSVEWLSSDAKSDLDSYTRLMEVEKRVRELYAQGIVAEPSEEEDVENGGQNTAVNSASGYYSNSKNNNACNDVVAGNVSSKLISDDYVIIEADGEGGGLTNSLSNGYHKPNSHQEGVNVFCGAGAVTNNGSCSLKTPGDGLNPNLDRGGSDSVKTHSTRNETGDIPSPSQSLDCSGQKNATLSSTNPRTRPSSIVIPSPVYIPPSLAMSRPRPVLGRTDSVDIRRTSVVSGSTDASCGSLPWDSGYVHTTSCRSSESSGAAQGETASLTGNCQDVSIIQINKVTQESSSSGSPAKSGGSGEDINRFNRPESGGVINGTNKSKKKTKNKKPSGNTVDRSPPAHPDLYYLFRPDLSSEKKPKADTTDRHCYGFDENKNRRCFCGTAGLDPLADRLNYGAKGLGNKDKLGPQITTRDCKKIEGCMNASFLSQVDKEISKAKIDENEPQQPNGDVEHFATEGPESVTEPVPHDETPSSPPPNFQHTGVRSGSLDSNKTTGSDDVFHNNDVDDVTQDTITYSMSEISQPETNAKWSVGSVPEMNREQTEVQNVGLKSAKTSIKTFDAEKNENNSTVDGSAQINAKLELIKSNLDSSVMETETKTLTNKTLHFGSQSTDEDNKIQINGEPVGVTHSSGENVHHTDPENVHHTDPENVHHTDPENVHHTDPENVHHTDPDLDLAEREHKTRSAFTTVKSLTAKFEAAQRKRSPSRIFEAPQGKNFLRRATSLGPTRFCGHSRVTSGRSGRLHHFSVDSVTDSDDEASDRKDNSYYQNTFQNGSADSSGILPEEISTSANPATSVSGSKMVKNGKESEEQEKEDVSGKPITQSANFDSQKSKTGINNALLSKEDNSVVQDSKADISVKEDQNSNSNKYQVNGQSHDSSYALQNLISENEKFANDKQPNTSANNINNNNNKNFTSMKSNNKTGSSTADIINQKNNINSMNNLKFNKSIDNSTQLPSPQSKLTNPSVAATIVDTKFYGDSDEDTSVHEARVQSFKDSYKRFSANCVKTKSGSPENPNSQSDEKLSPEKGGSFLENGKRDRNMKLNLRNGTGVARGPGNMSPNSARLNQFGTSSDSQSSPAGSPILASSRFAKPASPRKPTAPVIPTPNIPSPSATGTTSTISNIPRSSNNNNNNNNNNMNSVITSNDSDVSSVGPSKTTSSSVTATTSASRGGLPSVSSSSSISTTSSPSRRPSSLGRKLSDLSSIHGNFRSRDPGARWRLDYTNIHVDTTDLESLAMSSVSRDGAELEDDDGRDAGDSRRFSCLSTGSDMKNIRLSQFLKDTAESFTSQFGYALDEDMVGFVFRLSADKLNSCVQLCGKTGMALS